MKASFSLSLVMGLVASAAEAKPVVVVHATGNESADGAALAAAVANPVNAGKILQLEPGRYAVATLFDENGPLPGPEQSLVLQEEMEIAGANEYAYDDAGVPIDIAPGGKETVIDVTQLQPFPAGGGPQNFAVATYDCNDLSHAHPYNLDLPVPLIQAGRSNRISRVTIQRSDDARVLVGFHSDPRLAPAAAGWETTIEDSKIVGGKQALFTNSGCETVGFVSSLKLERNIRTGGAIAGVSIANAYLRNPYGAGASIEVVLRQNRFANAGFDPKSGFAAVGVHGSAGDADNSQVEVLSVGNVYQDNFRAVWIVGGHDDDAPGAIGNQATFTSHGDSMGGSVAFAVVVTGGFVLPGEDTSSWATWAVNDNTARAELVETAFSNIKDLALFGALVLFPNVGCTGNRADVVVRRATSAGGLVRVTDTFDLTHTCTGVNAATLTGSTTSTSSRK
jgi:hypothetical protein